ncbi:TPA: hypothetical protein N0F65_001436 [Lagenidium giganteum]|uniref:USP domain-containing protein n=1 Tax=Lagenidium giganteum TaxID=4803 RepID=A0AAV2Z2I7_9STRA|nr:TPA: hypothetical protein N0F65_001436 [Lagenidium giganteum]
MTKSWAQALVMAPLPIPRAKRDKSVPVPFEQAIQQALADLDIHAPAQEMKKRGLVNQGNTCFQNSIMQSVLACPPFLNLLVEVSSQVAGNEELLATSDRFKAWRHMIAFTREFEEPTLNQSTSCVDMGKIPKPIKISGYFMDVLGAFQKSRGEQEDALEFLEFFLDYLHSEYEKSGLELPKVCERQTRPLASSAQTSEPFFDGGDEWAEVGKKGKSSVMRQNPVDVIRSPINLLFKGSFRSELKQNGRKQSSITIEPFHCLHLNLELEQEQGFTAGGAKSSGKTWSPSIIDMIKKSLAVEVIEGINPSQTLKRYMSIESLPVVLTLHIKRFTYHPEQGPVKLSQTVRYPPKLDFPTYLLSPSCKAEFGGKNPPTYELFAVVSHHGKFVVGGHYTAVCRDNKDQWFHFDDEHVSSISEAAARKEEAYLLFYIRSSASKQS